MVVSRAARFENQISKRTFLRVVAEGSGSLTSESVRQYSSQF